MAMVSLKLDQLFMLLVLDLVTVDAASCILLVPDPCILLVPDLVAVDVTSCIRGRREKGGGAASFPSESDFVQNSLSIKSNSDVVIVTPLISNPVP
jgi:hypothetical protein